MKNYVKALVLASVWILAGLELTIIGASLLGTSILAIGFATPFVSVMLKEVEK